MKKILSKKVRVFGKGIPVFAIVLVGAALVSAALLSYYATITGLVTISQGLTWDGADWDNDTLRFAFNGKSMTSLEEKTFNSTHYLKNDADVDAEFNLSTTCQDSDGVACDAGQPSYWYEYDLKTNTTQGSGDEDRVIVLASEVAGVNTLNDLNTISWEFFLNEGYIPHVDIFLDTTGDGVADVALIVEGAHQNNNNVTGWATETWLQTFSGVVCSITNHWATWITCPINLTNVNTQTNVWRSGAGGTAGNMFNGIIGSGIGNDTHGANLQSLSKYKSGWNNVDGTATIVRFEFEVDNWVLNSESLVRNILINGNPVEVSGLKAGDQLDFNFMVHFPKMMKPDTYNITTNVLTA